MPPVSPLTTPLVGFTVATLVVPLVHVPPETEFVNVVVPDWHKVAVPPIAAGAACTVTFIVATVEPQLFDTV